MKKLSYFLTVALLAAAGMQASAEGDNKMVVSKKSGPTTQAPVETISKITFDGNEMKIATIGGMTIHEDVENIDKITFELAVSSADDISADLDGLTVDCKAGVVTAKAASDTAVTIDVYALTGIRVLHAAGAGQATADLNVLAPGTYVVKANDKTLKFIR